MYRTRFFSLLIFSCLLSAAAAAQDSIDQAENHLVYVYQRINVLIAHHDNRVSLRKWADGTVEMRFPHYAPQAGIYRWAATATERGELAALFAEIVQHDASLLEIARASRAENELVLIADADLVRFEHHDAGRTPYRLMLQAPDAWAEALPESAALAALALTESQLLAWMRARAAEAPR